ncbi:MAG TPA: antibiotic biosynthesis monooxygenase family protein [Mycobacteriales bacterium]|jgi:heme-degrading monooxygenase HmoA|nr:antibiotic biosynthesis monooxygenase family protein [Mycobacteriales bacterium]
MLEVAQLSVLPESADTFAAAYARGVPFLSASPGFRSARLVRGVESPSSFMLFVEWDSLAAHEAFRAGEGFGGWRGEVGPHFATPPHVEHFTDVG